MFRDFCKTKVAAPFQDEVKTIKPIIKDFKLLADILAIKTETAGERE
jgi:hypothetical protein